AAGVVRPGHRVPLAPARHPDAPLVGGAVVLPSTRIVLGGVAGAGVAGHLAGSLVRALRVQNRRWVLRGAVRHPGVGRVGGPSAVSQPSGPHGSKAGRGGHSRRSATGVRYPNKTLLVTEAAFRSFQVNDLQRPPHESLAFEMTCGEEGG